ncbi:MAG: 23S rRNA (uracil(1939)-C(5))-methyltransferase RlmD, partial [Clostridia bacterium]|nr:23S rRNA (uracil(1939)-C(5))-methyltransferase RlmD [Clostridia bacterium]
MKKSNVVEKNEYYDVVISDLNSEAQGVAKVNGFTLFIEGALPGEQVKIKVVKVKKRFGYGKLIEVIKPSSKRQSVFCKASKRCGGCKLQHMDYKLQLEFKKKKVEDALKRIGGMKDIKVNPVIGMDHHKRYRNKAQFPVGYSGGQLSIGFFAERSHDIIDIDSCSIQAKQNDQIIRLVKEFIQKYDISVYDESSDSGLIRHVVTRVAYKTGETMVILVINGDRIPHEKELIQLFKDNIPDLKTIVLNVNTKKTNVILGYQNIILYGDGFITDYIGNLKFKISPLSFFQVNPVQTEVLYNKVIEYCALTGQEVIVDAYCGIGTITLFLAGECKKIYGIEEVGQAVQDAQDNAILNRIDNAKFICGKSEDVLPKLVDKGLKPNIVVVDPPRKGCDKKVLDAIYNAQPSKIVYVSCNPSTLARDLKYLGNNVYAVERVQPVDMFPYTS